MRSVWLLCSDAIIQLSIYHRNTFAVIYLSIEAIETSMKSKVTPEDVFLGSEPSPVRGFPEPLTPPPVRFSSMPSVLGVWIFSGITQRNFQRKIRFCLVEKESKLK